MPNIALPATVWLSDETHEQLQELTRWYNEWAAENPETKHEAPWDEQTFLAASIATLIRLEHMRQSRYEKMYQMNRTLSHATAKES